MNSKPITPITTGEWWTIILGVAFIVIIILLMMYTGSQEPSVAVVSTTASTTPVVTASTARGSTSAGTVAKTGDSVTVNYTGMLADGTVFDSSASHGQPFTFTLGVGQVISGWDKGVVGMKVGQTKTLVIPPADAYGAQGVKNPSTGAYIIPPNATLTFQVTLVSVESPTASK